MRNLFNDSLLMQKLHPSEIQDTLMVLMDLIIAHATHLSTQADYITLAGQVHLKLHGVDKYPKPTKSPLLVTLIDDMSRINVDSLATKRQLLLYFKLSSTQGPVPLAALAEFGYLVAQIHNRIFRTDVFIEDGYIDLATFEVYIDEDKIKDLARQYKDVTIVDDVLTSPPLTLSVNGKDFTPYSVITRRFN